MTRKISVMPEMTTPESSNCITTLDMTRAEGDRNMRMTFANFAAWITTTLSTVFAAIGHSHTQLHNRQHALDSTDDHTGTASEDNFLAADGSGLPKDSGIAYDDPVLKSMLTQKGDLYVATGAGVVAALAVGADGYVPRALLSDGNGIVWGTCNYYGTGTPTALKVGETWLDTSYGLRHYRVWSGTAWVIQAKYCDTNTTITVGVAGDFATIQEAHDALEGCVIANCTVTISPDVASYDEALTIDQFICTGSGEVVLLGDDRNDAGKSLEITNVSRSTNELTFTVESFTNGDWSNADDVMLWGFEDAAGSDKFDIKSVVANTIVVENANAWAGSALGTTAAITSIAAPSQTTGRQVYTCAAGVDNTNIKAGMFCYVTGTTNDPDGVPVNDSGAVKARVAGTASGAAGFNVNGLTLLLKLDAAAALTTITFAGADPISLADVITAINTQYGATIAYAYNTNYLEIRSTTTGETSSVWIDSTSTALTVLGFNGTGRNGVWHKGVGNLFRVAAVAATTITLVNYNGIIQAGAGGTLYCVSSHVMPRPSHAIDRTTAGRIVYASGVNNYKIKGFILDTATGSSCIGVQAINGYIDIENCYLRGEDYGVYVRGTRGRIGVETSTIKDFATGIYALYHSQIELSNTITVQCSTGVLTNYMGNVVYNSGGVIGAGNGLLAQYQGLITVSAGVFILACTNGFYGSNFSNIRCTSAKSYCCGSSYRVAYMSYIVALTTLSTHYGDSTNYNPATSDTEGNVSSIITWS